MLDYIAWTLLIGFVIYYIRMKTFWFRDVEKEFDKEAKELVELARGDKEFAERWPSELHKKTARLSEERVKEFAEMRQYYLHFKERYRHDEKVKHIYEDWLVYLKAIRDQLDCQMDYGMLDDENLLAKTYDKDEKSRIILGEIAGRWKKYNGK